MLTYEEAFNKLNHRNARVRFMKPFEEHEIEHGFAYDFNEMLASYQSFQEKRRHSSNPFIRATQYLYDTYEFDEDGEYLIPAKNAEDRELRKVVKDYNSAMSRIEVNLFNPDSDFTKFEELYKFLR